MASICAISAQADVNSYFQRINTNPQALYTFFKKMPKGGELHYHLPGGPPPEVMLSLVAQKDYCLNERSMIVSEENKDCQGTKTRDINRSSPLYKKIIRSWSMEEFHPGAESSHDHFFASFLKYIYIVANYRPQLVANVVERAAEQNEHYLEIMDMTDNAHSASFGTLIKNADTYAQKKELLLSNKEFQKNINNTVEESERVAALTRKELGCDTHPKTKKCQIKVNFLYHVLREQPLDNIHYELN